MIDAVQFGQLLVNFGACPEGVEGTKGKSWKQVWETCDRPDWLFWFLDHMIGKNGWPTKENICTVLSFCIAQMEKDTDLDSSIVLACKAHAAYYASGTETQPLILSHDLVVNGYFGDLKKIADVIRANITVPF